MARHRTNAFSLLEVLVVMAIVAALALISVPAFEQLMKGSRITIAGRAVVDELSLARQTALSRNLPVQVRIYLLPETDAPAGAEPSIFRALQSFVETSSGLRPIGKTVFFPPGIAIEQHPSKSSIFDTSPDRPLANPNLLDPDPLEALPVFGTNYKYIAFRFKGNGETNFSRNPAFLTLVARNDKKLGTEPGALPPNFVTVQIDPLNGQVHSYRP